MEVGAGAKAWVDVAQSAAAMARLRRSILLLLLMMIVVRSE